VVSFVTQDFWPRKITYADDKSTESYEYHERPSDALDDVEGQHAETGFKIGRLVDVELIPIVTDGNPTR
jgi:hypothetical protein